MARHFEADNEMFNALMRLKMIAIGTQVQTVLIVVFGDRRWVPRQDDLHESSYKAGANERGCLSTASSVASQYLSWTFSCQNTLAPGGDLLMLLHCNTGFQMGPDHFFIFQSTLG